MENYKKITSPNENQISEMTSLSSGRMGDSSLDYDLPIEKDIPITQENISNDYYKPQKKIPTIKTTRKGNMIMMCYNSNGEPLIAIGPHWPFTLCMMFFINAITFFYFHFLKNFLHKTIKNIGLGISFIQIFSYILIFLLNPGIPSKDLWIENYFKNKNNNKNFSNKICRDCKIIMESNENIEHCKICNICVMGMSSHSFWIGKCIGKKNKCYYYCFILMTFILAFYLAFAFVSIPFNKEKNIKPKN